MVFLQQIIEKGNKLMNTKTEKIKHIESNNNFIANHTMSIESTMH